jgi:hypothetical protein
MADYYPLIAKAVSGLDKSTGEARRALYDRARTALLAQLRGVEPALSEPDITRERLALEEAIRKVEAEAARRSRGEPLPAARPELRQEQDSRADGAADPPEELPNPLPRYDLRASRPTIAPAGNGDDRSDVETQQVVPLSPAAAKPVVEARQVEESRIRTARAPTAGAEAPPTERTQWSRGGASVSERALKAFREGIAEDALEGATAPPPYPSPHAGEGREAAIRPHQTTKPPDFERFEPRPGSRMEVRGEPRMDQAPEQPLPRRSSRDVPRPPSALMRQDDARSRVQPFPRVIRAEREPERTPPEHPLKSAWSVPRTSNRIVATVVMALLVLAIAGAAYWWGEDIVASIRGATNPARTADQVAPPDTSSRGKIAERAPSAPSASEGALLAQKVVLYEEDQANPNGTQFVGSAVWRTERVAPGPGQKPDVVVRAEIEIPEQKVSVRLSLRRNDDKQLPASHTVEVVFTLPPDFSHGGISNIPGILMKQGETTRGVPLNGVAVKVTANFFLIGLSSVDVDMQRNVQLLKERSWFDIPVVYGDGKRAIIAIEKGTPGERAFTEAFATWGP